MSEITDHSIPRDRWDRPMLYPPNETRKVGYSRPSTLGKDLDKGDALIPWSQAMVAIGLAHRPNLFARVQAIVARGGDWNSDKQQLKNILEQAKEAAGHKDAADRGTSIHDFCDAAERGGLNYDLVPGHLRGLIESYEKNIVPMFKYVATECFVTVDRLVELPGREPIALRAAGSIDRIVEFEGKRYILDVKTGKDDVFRTGVSGQLWLYAVGKLYADDVVDQDQTYPPGGGLVSSWEYATLGDDNLTPVNPSLRASTGVEQDYAIMAQAPKFAERGEWKWKLFKVPLDAGREIVEVGQMARKARSVPKFEEIDL